MCHDSLCGTMAYPKHTPACDMSYWIRRKHVLCCVAEWEECTDYMCAAARGEPFDRDMDLSTGKFIPGIG